MSTPIASYPQPPIIFSVSYPGWLAAVYGGEQPRSVASAWVDRVSEQDARVFSDTRFEVGQWVELCIRLPEENRNISGKALVEWVDWSESVRENSGFRWVLGLSLNGKSSIPQPVSLADRGVDQA